MNSSNKVPPVKLFASFDRNIFIPLVAPNNTPEIIHQRLKAMGARIGRDSVEALIQGTVEMVKDFQVVTVNNRKGVRLYDEEDETETVPTTTGSSGSPDEGIAVANSERSGSVTHVLPSNTIEGSQQVDAIPVYHEPEKQVPVLRTSFKKKGKSKSLGYLPSRTLVAVRKHTAYARIMERLLHGGATVEELRLLTGNVSTGGVSAVLFSKIKSCGYGVSYSPDDEKYRLVLPKGISEIIYATPEE